MEISNNSALVLIDLQKGFEEETYWGGNRNNTGAEKNAATILNLWRKNNYPIFHIKHCSTDPKSPLAKGKIGNQFLEIVMPKENETVIEKNVNSAFIGTDLQEKLDKLSISTLVIVGLTTDHCVSTSTRMAGNFGYNTFLVEDATATFDKTGPNGETYPADLIHKTAIASLHEEFATIINTDTIMKYL